MTEYCYEVKYSGICYEVKMIEKHGRNCLVEKISSDGPFNFPVGTQFWCDIGKLKRLRRAGSVS